MSRRDNTRQVWTRILFGALVVSSYAVLTAPAAGQELCARLLADATDAYQTGRLDTVLERTNSCLTSKPSASDRETVFSLQTKVFLALDNVEQAQDAVLKLLQVNPDFAPTLDDPVRFRGLVIRIRRELARDAVSSVSKMNESVPEAPATVVVVTGDQIRLRGYRDLEEVLHDLPGFDISRTNGQNYSNVYQRGYRSDATNRTLFLVDGVEQNDLFSNIANISRQYPLSDIDRVEVIYGPASTMYGANAFLGVINVLTRDPEDRLDDAKPFAGDAQVGTGSWDTRSFDGTVAGRLRGTSFSLTGRVFRSDEWDLSGFNEWSYQYDPAGYAESLRRYLNTVPNAINRAITLDRTALRSANGTPLQYSDLTKDWMVSGKLKVKDFLFGLQMWQTHEGAASSSTQWTAPGALNGNIWALRQSSLYARYSTALAGSLRLSYFGQAKVHEVQPDSSAFMLYSYITGPYGIELFTERFRGETAPDAFWRQDSLSQSSNQLRHELNLLWRVTPNATVVGGVDLRHGSFQTDYVRLSNCVPASTAVPIVFSEDIDPLPLLDPAVPLPNDDYLVGLYNAAFNRLYDQGGAFLGYESNRPRCRRIDTPLPSRDEEPAVGGDHRALRELGLFGQASINLTPNNKVVAGLRFDNGQVNPGHSYGTVATPRLAYVYSPERYVFKAIYAEAFKDPAYLERFSRVEGIRERAGELTPERVRNFEVSAGRYGRTYSADVAMYRARYTDVIGVQATDVYSALNTPQFSKFSERFADYWYFTDCSLIACFVQALAEVPELSRRQEIVNTFLEKRQLQLAYTNSGTLDVRGVQLNASWRTQGLELFGNYTSTHPSSPETSLSSVHLGDIARHRGTIGATEQWRKLNVTIRVNMVGPRQTAAVAASAVGAYVASQAGRLLYDVPIETRTTSSLRIDPYAVANASVSYELAPGVTVQGTINNLFDTYYADPGIQTADNERFAARVPQPGRAFFVRLLTRF